MMYQVQAPRVQPDTYLSYNFITPSYPSVAKDGVSIFLFNIAVLTPAASLHQQAADPSLGGDPCSDLDLHSIESYKIRPD